MSKKQIKKAFPPARICVSTSQNAFNNTFPLDGKIKVAVAGVSQTGRKKWFPLARNSVSPSMYKNNFFKNWIFWFLQTEKKKI